jgi:hypothetical protein
VVVATALDVSAFSLPIFAAFFGAMVSSNNNHDGHQCCSQP